MSTPPPAYSQQPQPAQPTQPPTMQPQQPPMPSQPVYGQQPGTGSPAFASEKPMPVNTTVAELNAYALVAIIVAFLVPVAGIIFGHLGLSQIKRTGDPGRGLALTAVIYGYSVIALSVMFLIAYIGFIAVMIGSVASLSSGF